MQNILIPVLKYLLYPLSLLYGIAIFLRNKLYDWGLYSSVKFNAVPVIAIGNLSVGGTGKSPHIEYLIKHFSGKFHTATLSRGYRRSTRGFYIADEHSTAKQIGDEPMQFKSKFKNVVVAVGEDRVTAIPELLQRAPFLELILLDDAFQHRSVKAGLNVLITAYDFPFFNDFILPFGRLREQRSAYKRADIIIVSKCPTNLSEHEKTTFINKLKPLSHQQVFFSYIAYGKNYFPFGNEVEINNDTQGLLFSAIAYPDPLKKYLKNELKNLHTLDFKDHHYFSQNDIDEISEAFNYLTTENKCIFTTEKDATRLHLLWKEMQEKKLPIAVVPMEIKWLFNEEEKFLKLINDFIHPYFEEMQSQFIVDEINPLTIETEYEEII